MITSPQVRVQCQPCGRINRWLPGVVPGPIVVMCLCERVIYATLTSDQYERALHGWPQTIVGFVHALEPSDWGFTQ